MTQKQITFLTDILAGKSVRIGSTTYSLVDDRNVIYSGDRGDYNGEGYIHEVNDPSESMPNGSVSGTHTICDLIDLLDLVERS